MVKTFPLSTLVEKHGREEIAEMVGCHLTNINHVLSNGREVYVVLGEKSEFVHSFEVKPFPNRKISSAKKNKTSVTTNN